jgi:tetratricopeptide (TPR) repeat protein
MQSTRALIDEVDALLRRGSASEARAQVQKVAPLARTRAQIVELSTLSRRAGIPKLGLRLLANRVKPNGQLNPLATPPEIAEYAACLHRLGASGEAEMLLGPLSDRDVPPLFFHRALTAMARWDYVAAAEFLERYLERRDLTGYERAVAWVNRLAALVYLESFEEAERVFPEVLAATPEASCRLLRANLFEIAAQGKIAAGNLEAAAELLNSAEGLLDDKASVYAFFVRKWRAVVEARMSGNPRVLGEVAGEARALAHFESVRDITFHQAVVAGKPAKLLPLIFGTPHPALRDRYVRAWRELGGEELPREHIRVLGTGGPLSEPGIGNRLKAGQVPHRLLIALNRDYYRPLRLAELHAELFPEAAFHLQASATRVHQACRRLRRILPELRISSGPHGFQLQAPPGHRLRLRKALEEDRLTSSQLLVRRWVREMATDTFRATDFATRYDLEPRTAQRYLRLACEMKLLQASGGRRHRFFQTTRNIRGAPRAQPLSPPRQRLQPKQKGYR